ncbi:MAG: hypothetical protein IH586_09020 [Anaerolineaceae bacterium]|nr:hypothetical protein [Anaerolineaceae bacterium]
MQLPRSIRRFKYHILNQLTGNIARSSWGPFSILYNKSRRSGMIHETPVIAKPAPDGFVVALTYGSSGDWYANVMAAGQCKILWHQQETEIVSICEMETRNALCRFTLLEKMILGLGSTREFLKMKKPA